MLAHLHMNYGLYPWLQLYWLFNSTHRETSLTTGRVHSSLSFTTTQPYIHNILYIFTYRYRFICNATHITVIFIRYDRLMTATRLHHRTYSNISRACTHWAPIYFYPVQIISKLRLVCNEKYWFYKKLRSIKGINDEI